MAINKRIRSARHPDLEFEVENNEHYLHFKTFEEAAAMAISISVRTGVRVPIDVLTHSRAAAKAWAGEYGVEIYNGDPDASVHDRIVVSAESKGPIR